MRDGAGVRAAERVAQEADPLPPSKKELPTIGNFAHKVARALRQFTDNEGDRWLEALAENASEIPYPDRIGLVHASEQVRERLERFELAMAPLLDFERRSA